MGIKGGGDMLTEKDIEELTEGEMMSLCDMAEAHRLACEQKPAAWIKNHKGGTNLNWDRVDHFYAEAMPLYARPVPPKEAK